MGGQAGLLQGCVLGQRQGRYAVPDPLFGYEYGGIFCEMELSQTVFQGHLPAGHRTEEHLVARILV